jgi:hypothetical protein
MRSPRVRQEAASAVQQLFNAINDNDEAHALQNVCDLLEQHKAQVTVHTLRTLIPHAIDALYIEVLRLLLTRYAELQRQRELLDATGNQQSGDVLNNYLLLHRLCSNDDEYPMDAAIKKEMVGVLLEFGIDSNARDERSNQPHQSALHVACSNNNFGIASLLIEHGADVNARDQARDMPLHLAVERPHNLPLVRLLLASNARVNARNARKETPLFVLCNSMRRTESSCVQELLDSSANVNTSINGFSVLHAACINCSADTIKLLLERQANVHQTNKFNETPLSMACIYSKEPVLMMLIDSGADINIRSSVW